MDFTFYHACRGFGGRDVCFSNMFIHTSSACSCFCNFIYLGEALALNSMGLGCSTPWCSDCTATLRTCPCPHPVLPGGSPLLHFRIYVFLQEATWSQIFFKTMLGSILQQDCKFVCPHLYLTVSKAVRLETSWIGAK